MVNEIQVKSILNKHKKRDDWFIVLIVFAPLWFLECKEEEKEMIKLYRQKYIDYQKRTGIFLPRIKM